MFNLFKKKKETKPEKKQYGEFYLIGAKQYRGSAWPVVEYRFIGFEKSSNSVEIRTDPITKEKAIFAYRTMEYGGRWMTHFASNIEYKFGFYAIGDIVFLCVATYQKELKLAVGDKIHIILSNGVVQTFKVLEKPHRAEKDTEGVIIESSWELSETQIGLFYEFMITEFVIDFAENKSWKPHEKIILERQQRINAMAKMIIDARRVEIN